MKVSKTYLYVILFLLTGCGKDDFKEELNDGFSIVLNDKFVINHDDIDYYDFSSHLIYLKGKNPVVESLYKNGEFAIYADREKIYSGQIYFPDALPTESYSNVHLHPNRDGYGDYILTLIGPAPINDLGEIQVDPREDIRIVNALKKYDQFRAGLTCDIESIQIESSKLSLELTLSNNDSFNYYYLDPEKMGVGLFHHFATGLYIYDPLSLNGGRYEKSYNLNNNFLEYPQGRDYWDKEWFSLINKNESKSIVITYEDFAVPEGNYLTIFSFPGLNIRLAKEELVLDDGIIWQGEIDLMNKITIE